MNSNTAIRTSRYVAVYGGQAAGSGQATRPYMSSYRLGVQLPSAVATNPDGTVVSLTVSGANSYYQIDPVNGRLYFTDTDEGRTITVTYTGVDAAGGQLPNTTTGPLNVNLINETREAAIGVEEAINESQVEAFLDPFNYTPPYSPSNPARPGLIWLFWTSTRGGTPDVVFETIAPKLAPVSSR